MFALGCGRLFEGSPEVMWPSLQKLLALPDDTRVYCAHEYTQANARFALTVEPGNQALLARADTAFSPTARLVEGAARLLCAPARGDGTT